MTSSRNLSSYLQLFKHQRNVRGSRGQDGTLVSRLKNGYFFKKKTYKASIPVEALSVPFIARTELPNPYRRRRALIFFFSGPIALVPVSKSLGVGGIHYNDLSRTYGLLLNYKFGSRVSWVTWGNNRYASSRGSTCLLFFELLVSFMLILPSGQIILTPKDLSCLQDPQVYLKKYSFRKGVKLMKIRGRKPSVRGVATNPNDHPHGGRTKSILRPRTPWARNIPRKNNKKIKLS